MSFYLTEEEKPIGRYKVSLKNTCHPPTMSEFIIDFLGPKDQARKFGRGFFELKLLRLAKVAQKVENYAISTHHQLDLELPSLIGSDNESKLLLAKVFFATDQVNKALPVFPETTETGKWGSQGHKGAYNIRMRQQLREFLFLFSRLLPLVLLTTRLRNMKVTQIKALEFSDEAEDFSSLSAQ